VTLFEDADWFWSYQTTCREILHKVEPITQFRKKCDLDGFCITLVK
jgi:hypothetical protein